MAGRGHAAPAQGRGQAAGSGPGRGRRLRYNAACTFALAGRPEQAIAQLEEATKNLPSYITDWPRHDPDLRSLRGHPRFEALLGGTGASRGD